MSSMGEEDLERGLRDKQRGSQGDHGRLTGIPSPGPTLQCVELEQVKPVEQTEEGNVKKEKEEGRGDVSNSSEESRSRQTQEKDTDVTYWALCRPVLRILSAALYLFDVVSTLLVVREYHAMDSLVLPYLPYNVQNNFGGLTLDGVFIAIVIIIGLAHVANAIAFKLILPTKEQPIMSAYFLPFIQLRRLLADLWATGTCHRNLMISESHEAEALYAIMACAVETSPQLVLQISILQFTYVSRSERSPILFVSIAAGFLSGAFNGGRAVMYSSNQKSKIRSCACGILGGLYSFAALLSRCSIIVILVLLRATTLGATPSLAVYMTLVGVCPMVMIFLRARPKMRESLAARKVYSYGVRVCYAIVFGYVSSSVGPLYPIVSDARARKQLKEWRFLIWLLGMAFMHLIIDGIGWTLITTLYRENWTLYTTLDREHSLHRYYGTSCSDWGPVTCVSFRVGVYTGIVLSSVSIVSYSWLLSFPLRKHELALSVGSQTYTVTALGGQRS